MTASTTRISRADDAALSDTLTFLSDADIATVLAGLAPRLTAAQRAAVAGHGVLAHVAMLIFPTSVDELIDELRGRGLLVRGPAPSVVVRDRLSRRHGITADRLPVAIVPVRAPAVDSCEVELFVLPDLAGEYAVLADRERAECNGWHVAIQVGAPDRIVLDGLRSLLTGPGGLVADGGGYNDNEDCTVLYFLVAEGDRLSTPYRYHRLELRSAGHHAEVLAAHLAALTGPAERLLRLMTGAWTTQAIAVAVESGLVDHLPALGSAVASRSVPELADLLGLDSDGAARLLRYLVACGLVATVGDTYVLTESGALLRSDNARSMRALALMYGGSFYQSFANLGEAVRTGGDAFESHFGQHHFDYFAARPALAELFDASMAASTSMFEPIPELLDLTRAEVVVDIAGGTGELLGRILAGAPHLRGVLYERAHVLDRARAHLDRIECADRCDFVAGDFTRSVPGGGDVYLLSRVLHDWDDEQCRTILRHCAASIPEGGWLMVVERLLPESGEASLATAWDLHMLCNVGGRERTAEQYENLLTTAGFELVSVSALPLEGNLLQARRRPDILGHDRVSTGV